MIKIADYINQKLSTDEFVTQKELAQYLGVKQAILGHYKNGHTKQPSLEFAAKLYKKDGVVLWPYAEEAIKEIAEKGWINE
jgi:transcriptional regulator with XRE-family HTH domain